MKEWIVLADGTEVYNAYVVKLDEKIAIYINEVMSMATMYGLFGNPERTERIHSWQYGDEQDWIGYTVPYAMQQLEGQSCVCLKKEGGN